MKKNFCLLLACALLNACASVAPFSYQAEPKLLKKEDVSLKVVVPPFQDTRLKDNSSSGLCLMGLAVVPLLVPYCSVHEFNRPEFNQFGVQLINVPEDFAKATANELESASVFKSAAFSFDRDAGDLILIGNVKNMFLDNVGTYYGLTVYGGAVLGALGAPLDYNHRFLEIEYKLLTPSFDVLFEKNYAVKKTSRVGIWTFKTAFEFDNMLKQINMELIGDLKENIAVIKRKAAKKPAR